MNRLLRAALLILLAVASLAFNGCGTPQASYPALSEMAPMPKYSASGEEWNTDAVCWVGLTEDANWTWTLPHMAAACGQWMRENTSHTVQGLIKEQLQEQGYIVRDFNKEYPTREKRLGINKLVLFKKFEIVEARVQEGFCFDMTLMVTIVEHPSQTLSQECEIKGRCLVPNGQSKDWVDVFKNCVKNMPHVPQFRKALVKN